MEDKKDISISARTVLHHLNSLGYTHISGQQLKYFMKDLKKLIKYDMQQIHNEESQHNDQIKGPERLHDVPTYSWKSKCSNKENKTSPKHSTIPESVPPLTKSNSFKEEIKNKNSNDNVLRERKPTNKSKTNDKYPIKNSNLIKVQNVEKPKKSDPVVLYHYYASLWEKYKPNLPGENDWSDLRWSIREKLIGVENQRPLSAVQKGNVKKDWVD